MSEGNMRSSESEVINKLGNKQLTKLVLQQFPLLFTKLPMADKKKVWRELSFWLRVSIDQRDNGEVVEVKFVQVANVPSTPLVDLMTGILSEIDEDALEELYMKLFAIMGTLEDNLILLARMQDKDYFDALRRR